MPTGGGKSLCYAVPALMEQKLVVVVVVFPLLALLFDQFERMKSNRLNVGFLMKDMDEMDRQSVIHKLHSNPPEYNLLFLTPETVLSPSVFDLLSKLSSENLINFFVIDEAHCIDTWGFHFRPCYAELWRLGTLGCPIMAMTGTVTSRTLATIIKNLKLPNETKVIKQISNRANLFYHVVEKRSNAHATILSIIQKNFSEQCGIIYCIERRDTVEVSYHLQKAGVNAVFFHAGMDVHDKQSTVENWKAGTAHVICATVAFGMGIDKANVKFVIHLSIPKDLESYAQESGRAGRNGSEAHCFILFRFEDRTKHLRNISLLPDSDHKVVSLQGLNDIVNYCITPICRRKQIVNYFDKDDHSGDECHKTCDICVSDVVVEPVDYSMEAKNVIDCLKGMQRIQAKVTAKFLTLTFRGSKSSAVINKGFQNVNEYGKGKEKFNEKQLQKFIHCLINGRVLDEQLPSSCEKCTTPYLCVGPNGTKLKNNEVGFIHYK
ncbi:ATP-dependent DNA helicase [Paramuricea clavata]|uniref:ATP-dependent DNA helicase n=1 Tax=Paramuricea clavata TaxID=317549 RepID=A0A6S7HRG6_PARCT|nr:ATP-dependent DNA helicase [Paramuricea clavata]